MPEDGFFFPVEGYLAKAFAHVAVVGIGHFSRAVHDAAHDGYDHVLEARGGLFDPVKGLFQVVQRAAATGAGNVFRLVEGERPSRRQP